MAPRWSGNHNSEAKPTRGPKVKPMPKAAPIRAMPCLRRSGGVQSAITACAVEMVAPATPAPMRATKNSATASFALASDAVRHSPPHRREQKLHQRERRHQHADGEAHHRLVVREDRLEMRFRDA